MKNLPEDLIDEFMGFMAAHDNDDLPDGAWFQCLQDAAEFFIGLHHLKGFDENDLAHFYISKIG